MKALIVSLLVLSTPLFGQEFDQVIEEAMAESHVPGVAIVVIEEGKVSYIKGFGIREEGKPEKVNTETVFQVASVSKPITTTILALLETQWDQKISEINPRFQLSSPYVTANVTVRDLLCHRSGLPDHAGDLLEDLHFSRKEIIKRLRHIEGSGAFRASYAYTNAGFSEAAYAVAKTKDQPWNQLAKEVLFKPLGMKSASYSHNAYLQRANRATPHRIIDGKAVPSSRNPEAQAPAGGVSASISDLAKWMIFSMKTENKELMETQTPQMAIPEGGLYGLGWNVGYDHHGRKELNHSGAFDLGVRSKVLLIPEIQFGIAVVANASSNALPESLIKLYLDKMDEQPLDLSVITKYNEKWNELEQPPFKYLNSEEDASPAMPLEAYTGIYQNAYFGPAEIRKTAKGLELVIGPKETLFPLKHLNRDVFSLETIGEFASGDTEVEFTLDREGKATSLRVAAWDVNGNGTFTSKAIK